MMSKLEVFGSLERPLKRACGVPFELVSARLLAETKSRAADPVRSSSQVP